MTQDLLNQPLHPPTKSRPAQHDYILLDASGSMAGKWTESLSAIDNLMAQLRAENVNTVATVAAFTGSDRGGNFGYRILRQATPAEWSDLSYDPEAVMPFGMTPLYDAINMMARSLRDLMPLKASILIITDGDENSSKTTADQACAMLDWCRGMGWQVTFLGCDFENSRQAKLLGANDSNAVGVSVKRLTDATSLLAEKRANYSRYGSDMDFTKEDKTELGGLLPDHTSAK